MTHATNEGLRKSLHIAFGFFAITLRWLPWWAAAAVAAAAVVMNWLVLHRVVGTGVARSAAGYDAGIVIYPLAVALLIIAFRNDLAIAGAAWAILAFGDGFATLAGKSIGGARLPWHPEKSWAGLIAFVLFGFAGAYPVFRFLRAGPTSLDPIVIVGIAVVIAALVESLPLHLDDNATVPLFASLVLFGLTRFGAHATIDFGSTAMGWLVANTALALAGYFLGAVDVSGLLGGWLIGAVIIVFGGWPIYVALLTFFIIGTGATKLGYRRKAREGLAQEKGGRRGWRHAFANAGVAAILSIAIAFMGRWELLFAAAVASLATAAADTAGSEIGQLLGKKTFLPLTLRSVPRGTEGAVSIEGTLASLVAAFLVAVAGVSAGRKEIDPGLVTLIALSGFAGAYIEGIAGSWNRTRAHAVPNDALNFFNTMVGAAIALGVGLIRRGL